MAEQSRELAKYEPDAPVRTPLPPLEIPRGEAAGPVEPVEPEAPPFAPTGRVRWTPRRVRRMVPSKLKEVVVAILGALEDPPRRGGARRRRLPGPDRWPPQAPPPALPVRQDPGAVNHADSVGGATREGAD